MVSVLFASLDHPAAHWSSNSETPAEKGVSKQSIAHESNKSKFGSVQIGAGSRAWPQGTETPAVADGINTEHENSNHANAKQ